MQRVTCRQFAPALLLTVALGQLADGSPLISPDSTVICGPITSNTTWTAAGSPYVVTCNVLVNSDVVLTIDSGVIVEFTPNRAMSIEGTLIARGTEHAGIQFTSNVPSPTPGDWGYILFTNLSTDATFDQAGNYVNGSILKYCTIEYAGGVDVSNNGAIRLDDAHPFIDHCLIRANNSSGLNGWNLSGNLQIANTSITENVRQVASGAGGGAGATLTGKGESEIVTIAGCSISHNTNYADVAGGLYLAASTINVSNCTVDSNTAFASGGGIFVGYGKSVDISHNNITGNQAYHVGGFTYQTFNGGGIYVNAACYNCGMWTYEGSALIAGNLISGNLASMSAGGIYIAGGAVTVSGNIIHNNQDLDENPQPPVCGAGIRVTDGSADIIGNLIVHNHSEGNGGGVYVSGGKARIHQNVFAANSAKLTGGGICVVGGTVDIRRNSIVNNQASEFPGINYCCADSGITYNLITGNKLVQGATPDSSSAVRVANSTHPGFANNNIYDNACVYELRNDNSQASGDITARDNWWGTGVTSQISDVILDYFDDASKSIIQFSPFLGIADTIAPIAPPSKPMLIGTSDGRIIVSWNANTESDLAGYRIYYGPTSHFPYANTIDVGKQTCDTLSNLLSGVVYHVAVTAVDHLATGTNDQTEGHESWFSEQSSFLPPDIPVLVSPADGTTDLDSSLTLFWHPSVGAYSYRMQLATDTGFSSGFVLNDSVVADTARSVSDLAVGVIHYWRVSAENFAGVSPWSVVWRFNPGSATGVEDEPSEVPGRFVLSQNYPNPFNPSTVIDYSVPARTQVIVEIFNVLGQRVRTIVNETVAAGRHRVEWTGADDAGRQVSSGVYFYRIQAGENVQTKKMLLLR